MMCGAGLITGCSSESNEGFKPERPAQLSRSPKPDISISKVFAGQNVYITAGKVTGLTGAPGRDILVVEKSIDLEVGADNFHGAKAVIWIKSPQAMGETKKSIWCYITGPISAEKGNSTRLPGLHWQLTENGQAMVVWFSISGDAFVTARNPQQAVTVTGDFYNHAFSSVKALDSTFAEAFESITADKIEKSSKSPNLPAPSIKRPELRSKEKPSQPPTPKKSPAASSVTGSAFGFIEQILGSKKAQGPQSETQAGGKLKYPVNFSPAGAVEPNIEMGFAKSRQVATVIGRFYLWQQIDEQGGLLEMLADSAVIFYSTEKKNSGEKTALGDLGAAGAIEAVYLRGDVIITEGFRTIKSDEMYYDFVNRTGLAVNASLHTFDIDRGIPIYIRAAKVRQLAQNKFDANDAVITTSEFATPQVSIEASQIIVTDNASIEASETGQMQKGSYNAQMKDIRLKYDDTTLFYWPGLQSNLERPDVPLKTMRIGHDSIWGTTVETKWYLARLLGLNEPDGTNENFDLDYYSKRGLGTGGDVEYQQQNRQGRIIGYFIDDHGKDRLGRVWFRRDLEPPDDDRGRFEWVHREFMPYNWQLTAGINYESDEHFVESYYRREFSSGPPRETYIHLKRIEDNWGLAFLGKGRLNDFEDELDEAPTGEYHLEGQSLLDDKFTYYGDTYGGRFRQHIGEEHNIQMNEDHFTNGFHRSELDLPLYYKGVKAVPFISGTVGYDDRSGFDRSIVDGSNSGPFNERAVGIGELGLRSSTEFWNVYPDIKSRLLDIDGIRHIIRPELTASVFQETDVVVEQHDAINFNISQRLQTKRGAPDNGSMQKSSETRTVDWMRLDVGGTWFTDNDPRTDNSAPARFIWNRPQTPLRLYTMPGILNGDLSKQGLTGFETYGPYRDYFNYDYMWQISDTTALLSDAYYDIHNGTFEQVNIGFSRMVWPDLSYYIGSRYLRDVKVLKEHGSNSFIFAASYHIDQRYTIVMAQQYDFDYGANVESDATLIRRYGRVFMSVTASTDASLDRKALVFSIWPDGIPDFAIGSRRYTTLTGGY